MQPLEKLPFPGEVIEPKPQPVPPDQIEQAIDMAEGIVCSLLGVLEGMPVLVQVAIFFVLIWLSLWLYSSVIRLIVRGEIKRQFLYHGINSEATDNFRLKALKLMQKQNKDSLREIRRTVQLLSNKKDSEDEDEEDD